MGQVYHSEKFSQGHHETIKNSRQLPKKQLRNFQQPNLENRKNFQCWVKFSENGYNVKLSSILLNCSLHFCVHCCQENKGFPTNHFDPNSLQRQHERYWSTETFPLQQFSHQDGPVILSLGLRGCDVIS